MSKEKKEKDKEKREAVAGAIAIGIVLLLAIWGYRWFSKAGERIDKEVEVERTLSIQRERQAQDVLKEVLSIKGIHSQIYAVIRLREIEGHELKIVDGYAVPTSGDWWKVGFYLLEDGSERNLYEWNYNLRTKKIFPTSYLAKLLIYDW